MPAKEQLKRIVANRMIVNPALQKIDGSELSGWIWSSSEYAYDRAWVVGARGGNVYDGSKYAGLLRSVCSCLLGKLTKNSLCLQGVF